MARITQQGAIHTTGISYENEPIIRSDAAGEIMQWQPSDGGVDGIYITELVANGPAYLGIGVATPVKPLHVVGSALVKGKASFVLTGTIDPAASTTVPGVGTKFLTEISVGDEILVTGETRTVSAIASNTSLTVSAAFSNNSNDTSPECKPAAFTTLKSDGTRAFEVDNAGGVTIPGGMTFSGVLDLSAGSAGAPALIFNGDTNTGLYQTGADGLGFSTAGALRLDVASDGDVSIGTGTLSGGDLGIFRSENTAYDASQASHQRDEGATLLIHNDSTTTSSFAQIVLRNRASSTGGCRIVSVEAGADTSHLAFVTGDTGEKMRIDSAGTTTITPTGDVKSLELVPATATTASAFQIEADSLTTGRAGYFYSNASGTQTRNLVWIRNDHASATGTTCLEITNDSTGPAIKTTGGSGILVGSLDIGHGLSGNTDSVAVGKNALDSNATNITTGALRNTAIGTSALTALNHNDADDNTAVGAYSADALVDGTDNTSLGAYSLSAVVSGDSNTGVGYEALGAYTGSGATAVGSGALDVATTATHLTAVGKDAMGALTHADAVENTAVGSQAAIALVGASGAGAYNTALGAYALNSSIDGTGNTAVGRTALYSGDCVNDNTAVGKSALLAFAGSGATAVGSGALDAVNGTEVGVTAVGFNALGACDDGHYNTAVGYAAGSTLSTGDRNTVVGYSALDAAADSDNVAIGSSALGAFEGSNATAVGSGAADAAGSQTNLTAVGMGALGAATSGNNCTAVGKNALGTTVDGAHNTAVGTGALAADCGDNNTAVGSGALDVFTGSNAVAVGYSAAASATSAGYLTAIGRSALSSTTDGTGNTAVGYGTLNQLTTGDYNTAVGHAAGQDTYGDHNTFMGRYAGLYAGDTDHCVAIGSSALQGTTFTDATCDYNNDPTITHDANASIVAGLVVSGTGIPVGSIIASITDSTHFELNQATTGGAVTNGTLTFRSNQGNYNIAIGSNTLDAMTTGSYNVAIGYAAGSALTDNDKNIAIGGYALNVANTGEHYNVAIGYYALAAETAGADGCIAIGRGALQDQNRDGSANTAVGYLALTNLGSGVTYGGVNCTAVGYEAGGSGVFGGGSDGHGDDNTLFGHQAGKAITTGSANTCLGDRSGTALEDGVRNVLVGKGAGQLMTDNNQNVAIGCFALDAATGGEHYNVAIGSGALSTENSNANYCVAIGRDALAVQNADVKNTAIGGLAGDAIAGGNDNTLVGYLSGSAIVGTPGNTAVGQMSYAKGTGSYNTVFGAYAGSSIENTATAMSGDSNVLVGYNAGYKLEDGPGNVLIGRDAGKLMTTGDYNIAIGFQAADGLVGAADQNIAIGRNALGGCTAATSSNIAIGDGTLKHASYAAANTNLAIGQDAGTAITSGTHNVLIGHEAGKTIASNGSMTAVGFNAMKLATGSNNTAFGVSAARLLAAGGSNTIVGANALYNAGDDSDGSEANNTAIGSAALYSLDHDDAEGNTAVGYTAARYYNAGSGNTALEHAINCTYIGHLTRAHSGTSATFPENETAIGYNTLGIGDNTVALGDTNITAIKGQVDFAAYSDRRIKRDIANDDTGLALIEKLQPVTFKFVNPADYPEDIRDSSYSDWTEEQLVTPAIEAADEVWEDVVVQQARDACEEETREEVHPAVEEVREMRVVQEACDEEWEDIVHPAEEAVYEDRVVVSAEAERTETNIVQHAQEEVTEERVVQEAREEIVGERHKFSEKEVTEESTRIEFVKGDGDAYVRNEITETETRIERTPLYTDHPVVNPDGTPCVTLVTAAKEAVVDEDGNEIEPAVAEVTEPVIHKCPVMESYIEQEAQEEVRETFVVQEAQEEKTETTTIPAVEEVTERVCTHEAKEEHTERRLVRPAQEEVKEEVVVVEAKDEWTETIITRPAEPAREEITERRLVSEAVEAKDAVYETVTVPAIKRPKDNDTVRLGLIAQDVQTALTEAGLEADLVDESPDGRLSLKYGSLVMPLIKAVQELSARVKQLEG